MELEIILSPAQAREEVRTVLNASISRTTFHSWRDFLGFIGEDLTPERIGVLSIFGRYVRSGQTYEVALKNTKSYLRSKGK